LPDRDANLERTVSKTAGDKVSSSPLIQVSTGLHPRYAEMAERCGSARGWHHKFTTQNRNKQLQQQRLRGDSYSSALDSFSAALRSDRAATATADACPPSLPWRRSLIEGAPCRGCWWAARAAQPMLSGLFPRLPAARSGRNRRCGTGLVRPRLQTRQPTPDSNSA
jgi:hypothetical protein